MGNANSVYFITTHFRYYDCMRRSNSGLTDGTNVTGREISRIQ